MHAAGLYPPPLSHSTDTRNPTVSPLNGQGTPDVKRVKRCVGKERRDAEASLAVPTAGSQPSDQLSG
ncbi:hypothetical protein D9753_10100 [Streptomyces dangxiongensis]|uniref:Uncharacterized protein n=1 Tax=Streptomyces dangxiongensis TaxID=1442032 RepID=A0A3G2JEP1_9ACTN|nr:hypothetical protein D9753_10100 [Streptomyces dangxiongensis]